MRVVGLAILLGVACSVGGGPAAMAATPSVKCQAGKNQATGKLSTCLHKAEAKLVTTAGNCSITTSSRCYAKSDCSVGETCIKDLTKFDATVERCEEKFATKWASLEEQAAKLGGACPDGLLSDDVTAALDESVDILAAGLAGSALRRCGNGRVEVGEVCDVNGSILGGSCVSLGFAGGVLRCSPGCTYDTRECYAARFVDNADGTLSDRKSGLMWEKKSDDGGVHDKDNTYTWSATSSAPYPPSGTAYSTFLATLNGGTGECFANYCDWRLPTLGELEGILSGPHPCMQIPCVDAAFNVSCSPSCSVTSCSCTQAAAVAIYWTSTTVEPILSPLHASAAMVVDFGEYFAGADYKTASHYVRAVRGDER